MSDLVIDSDPVINGGYYQHILSALATGLVTRDEARDWLAIADSVFAEAIGGSDKEEQA